LLVHACKLACMSCAEAPGNSRQSRIAAGDVQGQRCLLTAVLDGLRRVLASPRDVPAMHCMYGSAALTPIFVLLHRDLLDSG